MTNEEPTSNTVKEATEAASADSVTDAATDSATDLDYAQAQLAYGIIQTLLTHTDVLSDLVTLMARALDEDTQTALTKTAQWTAYMDSRRALERANQDLETFTGALQNLAPDDA